MKKTLLGLLVLSLLLAVLGGWLIYQGKNQQTKINQRDQYQRLKADFQKKLETADTLAQLEELKKTVSRLEAGDRKNLEMILDLRIAEQYYLLAEEKIWRARQMVGLLDKTDYFTHPFVNKYIDEGFDYYRKAKELIDALTEIEGDSDYNFRFYYARGNIYYRVLLFLASQDEAPEIFNQTALAWEAALRFKEKDVSTEINLELLNKKRQELGGLGDRSRGDRLQMLPLPPRQRPGIGGGQPHGNF